MFRSGAGEPKRGREPGCEEEGPARWPCGSGRGWSVVEEVMVQRARVLVVSGVSWGEALKERQTRQSSQSPWADLNGRYGLISSIPGGNALSGYIAWERVPSRPLCSTRTRVSVREQPSDAVQLRAKRPSTDSAHASGRPARTVAARPTRPLRLSGGAAERGRLVERA